MNKIVIEGDSLKDAQRLMKALFEEERSYASYAEMAEAAEKQAKDLKEARCVIQIYAAAWEECKIVPIRAASAYLEAHPSSLKNEEVLDKDKGLTK